MRERDEIREAFHQLQDVLERDVTTAKLLPTLQELEERVKVHRRVATRLREDNQRRAAIVAADQERAGILVEDVLELVEKRDLGNVAADPYLAKVRAKLLELVHLIKDLPQ